MAGGSTLRQMLVELLLTWYALAFLLTLWLGFQQTPADGEERAGYATAALVLLIVQALITLISLAGTNWFPLGAAWLAFTLLCHHAVIHRDSRFDGEACSCSWFQCSDVRNHETWVVAALTACWVSLLRV